MVIEPPRSAGTDAFMTIFNTDGSLSGACGNGTRCVALVLMRETGRETFKLETSAGLLDVVAKDADTITVDMGEPRFGWAWEIPLAQPFVDTTAIDLSFGSVDRRSCRGRRCGEYRQSARDLLGRRRRRHRPRPHRSHPGARPDVP